MHGQQNIKILPICHL